jgi:hypothetical protein
VVILETNRWKQWEVRGTAPRGTVFHAATWIDDGVTLLSFGGRDGQAQFYDDTKYRTWTTLRYSFSLARSLSLSLSLSCGAYDEWPVVLSELEMALPQPAKGKKEKAQEGAVGRLRRRHRGAIAGPDLEALVPDEVLLLIFSFLGADVTALCQAACTCRRFSSPPAAACLTVSLSGRSIVLTHEHRVCAYMCTWSLLPV